MQLGRKFVLLVMMTAALPLAACGLAGTNSGGYISGDGQVVQYSAKDRGEPASLSGRLLDGATFDQASIKGRVAVVNVWGAWCSACRSETPLLQKAHESLGGKVAFIGVDIRDYSASTALSYERKYGVTYPSIFSTDGEALLGIPRGKLPGSIPSTIVLDKTGRVAAVVHGALTSALTLTEVVGCVVSPDSKDCSSDES